MVDYVIIFENGSMLCTMMTVFFFLVIPWMLDLCEERVIRDLVNWFVKIRDAV